MSQQAAQADLQAAAYWRSVAQVDRQEASYGERQVAKLTTEAREETRQTRQSQRSGM
jgi:pyrroloquinoline quinone (PQQ) biosynthesis protein C